MSQTAGQQKINLHLVNPSDVQGKCPDAIRNTKSMLKVPLAGKDHCDAVFASHGQ